MKLHGRNLIGGEPSAQGHETLRVTNPATTGEIPPQFHEATDWEVDRSAHLAAQAFEDFRARPPEQRAGLLDRIATEIEALGDPLIERANAETALGAQRL